MSCSSGVCANSLEQVLQALAPFLAALKALAVESTYNWYWLVDGLLDAGVDVRLVNTAAIPQYAGLKHGNDHTDARHLAHLLRLNLLPEGYIIPARAARGTRPAATTLPAGPPERDADQLAAECVVATHGAWHTHQRSEAAYR
jgi:hypothetical protein